MRQLPTSGDRALDELIEDAVGKFQDPAPKARREAVERLWDAWERLKTLEESSNKRLSTEKLISRTASGGPFRDVLEEEARKLTNVGNQFHIRHFESDRSEISRPEHHEYPFHRLYALIHLLSRHLSRLLHMADAQAIIIAGMMTTIIVALIVGVMTTGTAMATMIMVLPAVMVPVVMVAIVITGWPGVPLLVWPWPANGKASW